MVQYVSGICPSIYFPRHIPCKINFERKDRTVSGYSRAVYPNWGIKIHNLSQENVDFYLFIRYVPHPMQFSSFIWIFQFFF